MSPVYDARRLPWTHELVRLAKVAATVAALALAWRLCRHEVENGAFFLCQRLNKYPGIVEELLRCRAEPLPGWMRPSDPPIYRLYRNQGESGAYFPIGELRSQNPERRGQQAPAVYVVGDADFYLHGLLACAFPCAPVAAGDFAGDGETQIACVDSYFTREPGSELQITEVALVRVGRKTNRLVGLILQARPGAKSVLGNTSAAKPHFIVGPGGTAEFGHWVPSEPDAESAERVSWSWEPRAHVHWSRPSGYLVADWIDPDSGTLVWTPPDGKAIEFGPETTINDVTRTMVCALGSELGVRLPLRPLFSATAPPTPQMPATQPAPPEEAEAGAKQEMLQAI